MFLDYFKKIGMRRFLLMIIGNIFIGIGVATFKLSGLGNDSFSGMNMAIASHLPISYANLLILVNLCLFTIQLTAGRKFIGAGTIVNAIFLGYIVTFFYQLFLRFTQTPAVLYQQIIVVVIGVIICGFGLSLYQSSDVGVAPYDALSLIMAERWPKISYFWHRIFTDALCALICFLFGGIVGLGTLLSAFGFGPVIQFFNTHITKKLLK